MVHINRGGDVTFHGPGQITGYPILDLDFFTSDLKVYMRMLEEVMIQTRILYVTVSGSTITKLRHLRVIMLNKASIQVFPG